MKRTTLLRASSALLLLAFSTTSFAQTHFFGSEPNQNKFEATPAPNMVAGDQIHVGACGGFNGNVFRVGTAPAPPAIYRHELSNPLAGFGYFIGARVQGRDAIMDLALPQSVAILATSEGEVGGSSGVPFVSWYGFGKSEELYVDFAGSFGCRGAAVAELTTSTVTPTVLTPLPDNGVLGTRVSVQASGTNSDTIMEIQVFDAEFNALYGYGTEGAPSGSGFAAQSFTLYSGRYYIAVSDTEMATHLPPSVFSHSGTPLKAAMDFRGGIINGSQSGALEVSLRVREVFGTGVETVDVTKLNAFDILWFQLDIGTTQETISFCAGDGSVAPCPNCSTESPLGAGTGCVNSTGKGGSLNAFKTPGFSGGDILRLQLDQLPANALSMVFVSLGAAAPLDSGGGLVCLAPGAIRLPVATTRLDGMATFAMDTLLTPSAWLGQTVYAQAAYRDAAAAPCNVNVTNGVSFLLW